MSYLEIDSDESCTIAHGVISPDADSNEVENVIVCKSRNTENGVIKMIAMINAFRNGSTVAKFISDGLVKHILNSHSLDELNDDDEPIDDQINTIIQKAFSAIDAEYSDEILATVVQDRVNQKYIADTEMTIDSYDALDVSTEKLTGGAVAVLILMLRDRLYVANTGNSMAILAKKFDNNPKDLFVIPVTTVHEKHTTAEAQRLQKLNINHMQVVGPTRCFGDYFRKKGFKEDPYLHDATDQPVIVDPFVYATELSSENCFIMLLSPTLIQGILLLEQHTTEYMSKMLIEEISQMEDDETLTQTVQNALNRVHEEVENKRQSKRLHTPESSMVLAVIPLKSDLKEILSPSSAPLHIKNQPSNNTVFAYPDFSDFFSDTIQMQDKRNACIAKIESIKEMYRARPLSSINEV